MDTGLAAFGWLTQAPPQCAAWSVRVQRARCARQGFLSPARTAAEFVVYKCADGL